MKGRHLVILIFVFGLSLLAILFRVLPQAKPAPSPPVAPLPPPGIVEPPPLSPPLEPEVFGTIEVFVKSKGAPVRGATVAIQKGNRPLQLTTGAEGRCVVPKAEIGAWQIVARAPGVASAYAEVDVESGKTARVELVLAAGVRLQGFVRDGAGNPVVGARVQMSLPDPAFTVRSDSNGAYVIQDIPTGLHAVTASSDRLRPQTVTNLELTVPGQTRPLDFTLSFGTTLAGRVVDESGTPVSRASVTVSNEVARMVRTDGNGDFRVDGLGESPITLSVVMRGFAPASERAVTPGRTDVTIRLARGAILKGQIDGTPEPFTVHLSRFDDALARWSLVRSMPFGESANNAFQVQDLSQGQYELIIETPKRKTAAPVALALEAGQTRDAGLVVLAAK